MTKKHALLGSPSGLAALEKCPGKIAFGRDIPDPPESEYAREGTDFHAFMEEALPLFLAGESYRDVLDAADAAYPGMSGTIEAALEGFKIRYDSFREKHAGGKLKFEVKVKINDDIFGTSDIVMWGRNIKTQKNDVVAIDWKHGMGVPVSAEENLQGIAYLLGAVKTLKIDNVGKCVVIIAQIRLEDGWSQFVFDGKDIKRYEDKIVTIVEKAKAIYEGKADMVLKAGSHCRFCKGASICPAQKQEHYDLVADSMEELPTEDAVKRLTLDEQVKIFLKKSLIEDFLDAVAKNLNAALQAGVTHPDIKMIRTSGRRKWIDEKKAAAALKKAGIKKPFIVTQKLIGIGEAEKALGKKKKILEKLCPVGEGNLEVVRASDKREAVKFDGIEELLDG